MPVLKLSSTQEKSLLIATVFAALVAVWFLQDYIMLILLSVVVVVLFNPVYDWLIRKKIKPGTAAALTLLASLLAVIIPVVLVSAITVVQIDHLVNTLSSDTYSQNITDIVNSTINFVNQTAKDLGLSFTLTMDSVTQWLVTTLESAGKALINGVFSSISGIFGLITTSIIYLYVFIAMIVKQDSLVKTVKKLNPLGDEISELYFQRIHAMTKATVRGQFIIAFCQGLASAAVLALVGLDNLFFFFLMLLTVLSIVPLGAGIVTIPIGIIMILTGNVWQGAVVILNHLIIVTNIDNVLRPILVPREAKLNSSLMILAVFAGLGMFGFFGIVLGPVLMIILVTTLQLYLEVFKEGDVVEHVKPERKKTMALRLKGVFARSDAT